MLNVMFFVFLLVFIAERQPCSCGSLNGPGFAFNGQEASSEMLRTKHFIANISNKKSSFHRGFRACTDDHCKDTEQAKELMNLQSLPNKEQLRAFCEKALPFLQCEKEYLECAGRSLEELTMSTDRAERFKAKAMLGGMSLIRDLCDKTSSFHKDYVGSVDCFNRFVWGGWSTHASSALRQMQQFFGQLYPDDDNIPYKAYYEMACINEAYGIACVLDILGMVCGDDALRAATTILEKMKPALRSGHCEDVENVADLKEKFFHFLELDGVNRNEMQAVFDFFTKRR